MGIYERVDLRKKCPCGKTSKEHKKCDCCGIIFNGTEKCDYISFPIKIEKKTLCRECITHWNQYNKKYGREFTFDEFMNIMYFHAPIENKVLTDTERTKIVLDAWDKSQKSFQPIED